jgi:uncharacterized membrane protein YhdT
MTPSQGSKEAIAWLLGIAVVLLVAVSYFPSLPEQLDGWVGIPNLVGDAGWLLLVFGVLVAVLLYALTRSRGPDRGPPGKWE